MFRKFLCSICLATLSGVAPATADTLRLYVDADFSVAALGGEAIVLGVESALSENNHTVGDFTIEVVTSDHRQNVKRTARLLERFEADADGLAIIGGVQSPNYLAHRDDMNRRGLLAMLPWSAAGPLTRTVGDEESFFFRLSVDDSKAGPFLVDYATESLGCEALGFFAWDTGWGRSNRTIIQKVLADAGAALAVDLVYSPTLGEATAAEIAEDVAASGADCMILVSGMPAGGIVLSAVAALAEPPKIISHWGILSGSLTQDVPENERLALDLRVLQTCGLQAERDRNDRFRATLSNVVFDGKPVSQINEIPAHVGFVHGYDITMILLAAVAQAMEETPFAELTARERQNAVRAALENLERPVDGLLQRYDQPFGPLSERGQDGHEALGQDDLCMAAFEGDRLVAARD